MAYVVQADDRKGMSVSISLSDRNNAISVARLWLKEGHTNVKIIGGGRVYTLPEFVASPPEDGDAAGP